jgi:lysozyme family protein
MTAFELAFAIVIGNEGGYTRNAADPGNWDSGKCGVGACNGTKFGISSAAYPDLDIAAMTLVQAQGLYLKDYWRPLRADELPASLAIMAFDAAVNNGLGQAIHWLQTLAEVTVDGVMGPITLGRLHAAIDRQGLDAVCAEYLALRIWSMSELSTWKVFGRGWSRRLARLPYLTRTVAPS